MTLLHGVIPAVLTPFTRTGDVDGPQLREYVHWLIGKGIHGLFPCGTNGEGPVMTPDQRRAVLHEVLEAADCRVPVVAMTGSISTAETIELTRHAREAGAAGAAIVAPYYFPHDDRALEVHFATVAEAVPGFDLYLYNIPGCAKNEISPVLAARLAGRYPQIKGVKDSSKSLEKLRGFLEALPGRSVIVGTDALLYDALEAGASGVVSAVADCFPEVMVSIYDDWKAGRKEAAKAQQEKANRLRAALKMGPYIHPYKLALTWRGLEFGGMRAPLRPSTAEEAAEVRGALVNLGVLP